MRSIRQCQFARIGSGEKSIPLPPISYLRIPPVLDPSAVASGKAWAPLSIITIVYPVTLAKLMEDSIRSAGRHQVIQMDSPSSAANSLSIIRHRLLSLVWHGHVLHLSPSKFWRVADRAISTFCSAAAPSPRPGLLRHRRTLPSAQVAHVIRCPHLHDLS